jgi:hypothetical protein
LHLGDSFERNEFCKKKQDKAPTPCEEEQYNRFIEAAREFECDENVEALERAVREIVPRKSGDR